MPHWTVQYGYPLLFFGTLVEGETFLLAAAVAAGNGVLDLGSVMAAASLGALTGDTLFFLIGKYRGITFLKNHPKWRRHVHRLTPWLTRYRLSLILGFRFWYGMRAIIPLAYGAAGFPVVPFMILNAAGALLWTASIAGLGYCLGEAAIPLAAGIIEKLGWGSCVVGLMVIAALFRYRRCGKSVSESFLKHRS